MPKPSHAQLAALYFRLGNATFGGGDPTMAALQRELTGPRQWLTNEQHGLAYGLARATPGTNVLAYCAATGWMILGWPGAVLCVGAVSVPTAVIAAWFCGVYDAFRANEAFQAAMLGIAASAIGMMAASGLAVVRSRLGAGWLLPGLAIVAAAILATRFGLLSPLKMLALAALSGALVGDRR
jgi:chromate transporter